ncbi:MAG: hypothetical protein PSX71_07740 [bacterium]|nr:hypothetical protein [bacterium]
MHKAILPLMLSCAAMLTACNDSNTPATPANQASTVAVIGDSPYGTTPTDDAQFLKYPAFISAINLDSAVSLVLHAGDTHSGKQYCTEAYDSSIYSQWTAFKAPLVYTPGDNEWADCHKAKEGGGTYNAVTGAIDYKVDANGNYIDYAGGNPVANLDLVRSMYFASPGRAFGVTLDVHSQGLEYDPAHPTDKNYVENVWGKKSGVLFVTLNIPGGSNNDTDPWYGAPAMSLTQAQEVASRSAANLRWLDTAFKRATADGVSAVVIMEQADMWDLDGNVPAHIAQYKQFVDSIAAHTTAFGKPVLLLNGDSHVFRSDNPLVSAAPCVSEPSPGATAVACSDDAYANQPNGYNVPNFHRVVVHGSTFPLEWLKLGIDPAASAANGAYAFGPFSWQRMQPTL